jgi:hypothetical protein
MEENKETHRSQLQDERWKTKRRRAVTLAMGKCSKCGFKGRLDVHHLYYIKGNKLWEYPFNALVVLCRKCHTKWHEEHYLEYRAEVFSENRDYEAPNKRKTYFVTKGKKSVIKQVPYKKKKKIRTGVSKHPDLRGLTLLQKAKKRLKNRKDSKLGFAPIPEWRLKTLNK